MVYGIVMWKEKKDEDKIKKKRDYTKVQTSFVWIRAKQNNIILIYLVLHCSISRSVAHDMIFIDAINTTQETLPLLNSIEVDNLLK